MDIRVLHGAILRRCAVGDRFVRDAPQVNPVLSTLPAIHTTAHRLAAVARTQHRFRDLCDEQLVLVQLVAWNLEEETRSDAVNLEHPDARLRLGRYDSIVHLRVRFPEPASATAGSPASARPAATARRCSRFSRGVR